VPKARRGKQTGKKRACPNGFTRGCLTRFKGQFTILSSEMCTPHLNAREEDNGNSNL